MYSIPKIIRQLVLQTTAMPKNTNPNGDIFGGWIMSQMDLGAAIIAKNVSKGRVATVAINDVKFTAPVLVGDIVSCKATLIHIGNTSMRIKMECFIQRDNDSSLENPVVEGLFTFVAISDTRRPRPIELS